MTTATETYAELVRGTEAQRLLERSERRGPERWSAGAERFREDPFRENETLTALLSYIQPDDTVLDIGGGAGRYLPLARRCRDYVNVEPSPGMGEQFEQAVKDAGVTNARWLHSDWLGAEIEGDVCFTANVVYYIEDIVPFVRKLDAAARRRVMIVMHSVPPTNIGAEIYRTVHGRDLALAPSHRELLPVMWEMGLLPDVRVLGPSDFIAERERYPSRDAALDAVTPSGREDAPAIRQRLASRFDDFFIEENGVYMRRKAPSRVLLITWEPKRS